MGSNNTKPKEILENIISVMEKTRVDDWEIDKLVVVLNYINGLEEKIKVSQTNEETYRLEMQDITKLLGLDEHTIFDDVKEYATNLKEKCDAIDKAIEYIEKHKEPLHHSFDEPDCDYWIATNPDDLLDILKGEKNE